MRVLILVSLWAGLRLLPALALPALRLPLLALARRLALALAFAESLISQLLLLARQLVEFVERFAHLARGGILLIAALGSLQVLQNVLQLVEHALRFGHRAVFRHVLEPVEHRLEILRRHRAVVARRIAVGLLLIALLAHLPLGQFLEEFVERGAQVFSELLDFLVAGAALQCLAQLLLRGAQIALGVGEIAVLDAQRHLPEIIGDGEKLGIGARAF